MNDINMRHKDPLAFSVIEHKNLRFLITSKPTDRNMDMFIQELKNRNAYTVVRVCDPTYKTEELNKEGIVVYDLCFDDGGCPPPDVIQQWFAILKKVFQENPDQSVAVHCVAGLGRAPVMVCLALIELGMKYEEAVEKVREKRRGAINAKQLDFLQRYRPKSRIKIRCNHKNSCSIQ